MTNLKKILSSNIKQDNTHMESIQNLKNLILLLYNDQPLHHDPSTTTTTEKFFLILQERIN